MSFTPLMSCHANDVGGAECVEADHECDADLDLGDLSVGVAGDDAFAEGFGAAPPLLGSGLPANHERVRLDATASVVSGLAFPECSVEVACGAQGFDPGWCCRAVLLPRGPFFLRVGSLGLRPAVQNALDRGGKTQGIYPKSNSGRSFQPPSVRIDFRYRS